VKCRRLAEALCARPWNVNGGIKVTSVFLAAGGIPRTDHDTVMHALGIAGYERLREENDLCSRGGCFFHKRHGLVDAGLGVERNGRGLDNGHADV
jgi:hypothetical protein